MTRSTAAVPAPVRSLSLAYSKAALGGWVYLSRGASSMAARNKNYSAHSAGDGTPASAIMARRSGGGGRQVGRSPGVGAGVDVRHDRRGHRPQLGGGQRMGANGRATLAAVDSQ